MPSVVTVFGLIPRYIGGSENYARELSLQLEKRGWKSVICFLKEPPAEVLHYLDLPNTKVEVLAGADGRGPSPGTLKHLATILRANNAGVLHLHLVGFVGLYPWIATVLGVKKVIFTNHMSQPEHYVPRHAPFWKRSLVKMINWPMSNVVCVSQFNYRCLKALDLLPESKLTCVYNGVDFSRAIPNDQRALAFRKKYSIPPERTLVAQVSWIIPEKGIGDLLEAGRLVVATNPNVHFVFAGDGAALESFTAQANDLGLGDHVTWTGLLRDPFAEGLYDAADVVCQPSRWQEAFGQVIAEAMAYAKPVIGTRVGGIPEVIVDGESGFVVESRDVKALADKIQLLAGDVRLRAQMGQAGLRIAKAKFDQRQIVNQIINLYDLDQFK